MKKNVVVILQDGKHAGRHATESVTNGSARTVLQWPS